MNFHARCLCDAPAGLRASRFVVDAPKSRGSDPTGTLPLQRRWARDLDARWSKLRRMIPDAVAAKTHGINAITHAAATGDDPVRAFRAWIDEAMRQLVLGGTGAWTLGYVRQAGDAGLFRASSLNPSAERSLAKIHDRIPQLQTLAVAELQGICDAVSQQAVRAFGNGILNKQPLGAVVRSIQRVIQTVGVQRGHMLVSFFAVRAYGAATLDGFRAAGVTRVGTVAERVRTSSDPARALTRDAKKKKKVKWAEPEDLVEVLTAGDDRVCPVCEDISEEGPYTLDEAERLIPAHVRCRCAFVPWHDRRYASVRDHYDINEPRDDHGMWSSVGGARMKSFQPPAHWADVEGQDHTINEPPLPNLKQKPYKYVDKETGETKTHQPKDLRLSSGVIMREPDGRVWLVKPTNGYGGYNWTFPKGGVERDLHPQANAIKEVYEETGLKARITGFAGDYRGDTSVTRMYHAVRVGGHPKDKGWETEQVALAHPDDLDHMLNRSRDRKIAAHHIVGDSMVVDELWNESDHPRDKDGKFALKGAETFAKSLKEGDVPHVVHENYLGLKSAVAVKVPKSEDLDSLEGSASTIAGYSHKSEGSTHNFYVFGHPDVDEDETKFEAAHDPSAPLKMSDLTKTSGKMGSNEGGVYKNVFSEKSYYVKQPASKDHVQNELIAAKLYHLAGVKTLNYVPVEGGEHVATELESLKKNNVSQLNPIEREKAQSDFAVHAWLANWDSVGTGGDNVGVRKNGDVVTLDTGGSLKYRAQGTPKGDAFGDTVPEIDTLRDASKNPDAAALYGEMDNADIVESIKRVTGIASIDIAKVISGSGMSGPEQTVLYNKLLARKADLAKQADDILGAEPKTKTILGPNTTVTAAPKPIEEHTTPLQFKTKMEHAKHLLLKGTTTEELKKALNWPAIGVPATAAKLGLKLTKTKVGGVFHYKGEPIDGSVAPQAPVAAAPAASTKYDVDKPHENFAQGIFTASGKHPSVGKFGEASKYHGKDYVAVGSIDPGVVATVAKYHPQMKAIPESSNIYTLVSNLETVKAEPSAFDKPQHTDFQNDLEKHGISANLSPDDKDTHYNISASTNHASKMAEVAKYHPDWTLKPGMVATYIAPKSAFEEPVTSVEPAPPVAPPKVPPTDAELQKAKKSTKLTLQYVPGAPTDHPEAQKLVDKFNEKYEGKSDLSPEALAEKVHAFKQLQASMVPLMSAQQKAEQAKAAAALAAQAAAKAKANEIPEFHDEEEEQRYWYNKQVGEGVYMSKAEDVMASASKGTKLKAAGLTVPEVAYIKAFTGAYSHVNAEMTAGVMEPGVLAFKHIMNEALAKMPKYDGDTVWRKINLTSAQQAEYVPGKVVHWRQFSSTSKNSDTWSGNTHFTIRNPKSGVDVEFISSNPSEAEVIMPADTYYRVLSKKQVGGDMHIEMEEVVYGKSAKKMKKAA